MGGLTKGKAMVEVALVGGAHIHTPSFVKKIVGRPDVKTKYVWDHDEARAKQRAEALGARVADLKTIWSDPDVPAVVICSETDRHEDLVLPAAKARKHLFVEKPLGLGARDAYRMAAAIEKAGVLFQTGYAQRGSPVHLFLRDHVRKGTFGRITRVRMDVCHSGSLGGWFDTEWRWMADPKQAGCGAFGDLGTHGLDLLLWIMGDAEAVTASVGVATKRYGKCDEFGEGLLRFRGGALGVLAASWVDVASPFGLMVTGTEGHACVFDGKLYLKCEKIAGADGKTPWTDLPAAWPHAFDLFLDAITGKSGVPLVGVREAAVRSAVMEAMYSGARRSRWVKPKRPPARRPRRRA